MMYKLFPEGGAKMDTVTRTLLYTVVNSRDERKEILVSFEKGTAIARECIKRGLIIISIVDRVVVEDFTAVLAEFAGEKEPA